MPTAPSENAKGRDPLTEALRRQEDASAEGFDWPDISGVFAKVFEEIEEIREALDSADPQGAKEELGDLLFTVVNLARFLDARPSEALREATARFSERYLLVKAKLEGQGRSIHECSLAQLDVVWKQVKRLP